MNACKAVKNAFVGTHVKEIEVNIGIGIAIGIGVPIRQWSWRRVGQLAVRSVYTMKGY